MPLIFGRPLCVSCGCFLLVLFLLLTVWPIPLYDVGDREGSVVTLQGRVDSVAFRNDKQQLYLSDVTPSGDDTSDLTTEYQLPAGVICYVPEDAVRPKLGSYVLVRGKLYGFDRAVCPGQFDMARYYQIRGMEASLVKGEILVYGRRCSHVRELLYRGRCRFEQALDACLEPEDAVLMRAMLLGDKDELTEEMKSAYRRVGQSHLLAISALHMSVVSGVLYAILKLLIRAKIPAGILTTAAVYLYGEMTGMSSSARRAVIMFSLCMLANLCGRTYDLMTAMAFSAVCSLLMNPLMIYDSGFLLSYFAVMGIGTAVPVMDRLFRLAVPWVDRKRASGKRRGILSKAVKGITGGIKVGFAVSLFTLPLTLYSFSQYPVYSLLLTLVMVPIMSLLLMGGMFCGFCGLFLSGPAALGTLFALASKPGALLCHLVFSLYEACCSLPGHLPGGNTAALLTLGQPKLWEIALYYAALLLLLFVLDRWAGKREDGGRLRLRSAAALLLPILLYGVSFCLLVSNLPSDLSVTVMDVGQGDGILIQKRSTAILVDGGSSDVEQVGKYRILPCIKALGAGSIDLILVSHTDADHISGIEELLESAGEEGIRIGGIAMSGNSLESEAGRKLSSLAAEREIPVTRMGTGDCVRSGNLTLRCLQPDREQRGDANEESMVMSLEMGNFRMLLTGDVEGSGEEQLIRNLQGQQPYSVYKAAHHGSRGTGSSDLLAAVRPAVCVVSAGTGYGHPHREAMERMQAVCSRIYVTKQQGTIRIASDGKKMSISAYPGE